MTPDKFIVDSHIFHRSFSKEPAKVVPGHGISLVLEHGKQVIDATCGRSVSCLVHSQPEITDAITDHLKKNVAYVYSSSPYTNEATEELARMLLSHRLGGLSKAVFVNSGSEATDAALKLAVQYRHEHGQPQQTHFIARKQSYHGNTIGALCVSGHESWRAFYKDFMSSNVSFLDPCYAYRMKGDNESDEAFAQLLARQFEDEILRVGPDRIAGFIAEIVSGTALGCLPADMICVGVLLHQKIFDVLAAGSGGLAHRHTFQAHPLARAAAPAAQKIIQRDGLIQRTVAMGKRLEALLRKQIGPLPLVGDIHGRGLFWAIEFVRDKRLKTAFAPEISFCNQVVKHSLALGLNILGNLGRTGKYQVDHVLVCSPYIVTDSELDQIVSLLKTAITKASQGFLDGMKVQSKIEVAEISVISQRLYAIVLYGLSE